MYKKENNIAFVDGQNLYMGTTTAIPKWRIDLAKFRNYLSDKYHVATAYYFLGYMDESNEELYDDIQSSGFILKFREHNTKMLGKKKGNVDSDIIFAIMKKMYKKENFNSVILVSGDGDYKQLVDFLIEENRFKKILFPNTKFASSLYKKLPTKYYDSLQYDGVRKKIEK
ncbi:MAG: NYN domain-containing protein [Candidatus Magasanikbacteria bacterium]|jgi:uncharacterized LabA/DUF88 family protein|nr:NYN domain-containing protein [Candidatus Magasanikbacteria bacterium]